MSEDDADKLLRAAYEGDLWTLTRLLDRGVDVNTNAASTPGFSALHAGAQSGSLACVKLLLRRGADLEAHPPRADDEDADTPLAHAVATACDSVAQKGGMPGEEPNEIVELLPEAGADPEPGLAELRRWSLSQHEQTPLAELLRAAQRRRQR